MTVCYYCGKSYADDNSVVCPHCGASRERSRLNFCTNPKCKNHTAPLPDGQEKCDLCKSLTTDGVEITKQT